MFKVVVTAKIQGVGSLSREFAYSDEPKPETLSAHRRTAKTEYESVYGRSSGTGRIAVDITVRGDAKGDLRCAVCNLVHDSAVRCEDVKS